ncbi:MAG TPA: dihydrodipicolinate synthase family protein [Stellaceae bacterium]|nr:dihydrodipicolinate synthase family protein [Stellaceae bacterium]
MDRNSIDWHGSIPAMTTPFDAQGRIDEKAFGRNVDRLLADGATGMVVGGCTGEFWALSHDERKRLYEVAAAAINKRGTLIVGTGAVTVDETVALTNHAEKAGCDGALILPPYFVKLTDNEIFAHYRDISGRTRLPILLYNIPGNAVNALSPALVRRLADLDTVVAVKESSGDWNNFYATLIEVVERIRVFCGPASIYGAPAAELGADGFIDCFPNVWAEGGKPLWESVRKGDTPTAARIQKTARQLTDLFTSGGLTLYPATKAAMDMMGHPGGGRPRPPLRPAEGEPLERLRKGLRELRLLP